MATEHPCSKTLTETIPTKPKRSSTKRRRRDETLHKKGSHEKGPKEEQVIAFVPNPNGKKTFYSTDKEDSKNYEPIIAYSLTEDIGKKMFYITDRASLSRKCKTPHEDNYRDKDVASDKENNRDEDIATEKGLSDAIFDLCQKTVAAASTTEKGNENRDDVNITLEQTDNSSQEEEEQQTATENNTNVSCEKVVDKKNSIKNDNSSSFINMQKDSVIFKENEKDNTDEVDTEADEDGVIFPGVLKKVQEISKKLFNTNESYPDLKEDPCEPQKITNFMKSNNDNDVCTTIIEDKEKEPVMKKESSSTIFESVKSKIFAIFAKKSTVSENNVTYKVETNIVSAVHARNIEKSASLYETMRKKVNSIFSLNNKDDENANTPPELRLGHTKSSKCFLRDIFFDDGFTS